MRQSVRQTGRQPWRLHMLAGRGHLIMFQQQLVASEQQMPRHPTAINPPTGRQPAAHKPPPSPRRRAARTHGRGEGGTEAGGRPLHRRASPSVSPTAHRPSVFRCSSSLQTAGRPAGFLCLHNVSTLSLGGGVCECVCVFLPSAGSILKLSLCVW